MSCVVAKASSSGGLDASQHAQPSASRPVMQLCEGTVFFVNAFAFDEALDETRVAITVKTARLAP